MNQANKAEKSVMSVFEHQRLIVQDFAYASDFMWLMAQELPVFSIKRQRGQWQLKVSHYIGVILLPSNITLEILPKTIAKTLNEKSSKTQQSASLNSTAKQSLTLNHHNATVTLEIEQTRRWVAQMLSALIIANDGSNRLPTMKNFGQVSANLTPLPLRKLSISQWLIEHFLQLLAGYHPSKHYQASTQNQATLQGKLLIKEQLRRNSYQPHKFVSEVSILSTHTLSNRLIKTALQLIEPLLAHTLRSEHLLAWRSIIALNTHERRQLDGLYLQATQQLSRQPLTSQQRQVAQQLLSFAYWLLNTQTSAMPTGNGLSAAQNPQQATTQTPLRLSLLLNMNQAFEQWASLRIAASFAERKESYQPYYQSQHIWLKDASGQTRLSMRPDLLMYKNQHCSHVIDIKWKTLANANDLSASDAYQLNSYAEAYQAKQVWLVYPVTNSDKKPVALHRQLNTRFVHSVVADRVQASEAITLWLIPFNVLTGSVEHWPARDRD